MDKTRETPERKGIKQGLKVQVVPNVVLVKLRIENYLHMLHVDKIWHGDWEQRELGGETK